MKDGIVGKYFPSLVLFYHFPLQDKHLRGQQCGGR